MSERPDSVLPDPFAKRAAPEKDYDAAIECLRKLDSEPVHEASADAIANEIIQILTAWPDDDCIEPKCIRLLRRCASHCPTIYQHSARWADHPQVLERHWAASILPAIEPEDARVVDWLEHPEIGPWPDRQYCPWPNQRHRAIDALLESWPKGEIHKDRLLNIIRDEQDVYLASDLVRLEPECPTAMMVYLECLGSQDPYHDRAHEIIDASYSYLRTIWPAHRNRERVTRAFGNHEMLVTSTLGPWLTGDERGAIPASSRQIVAASRVLFELGYPAETIAIALGIVLSEPWMCNNRYEVGNYCDIAALELLDTMGPDAVASLPLIKRWFTTYGRSTIIANHVLTTIVSIGSRSKTSLEIIQAVLKLVVREMEESTDSLDLSDCHNKTVEHAARTLSQLFEIDVAWLESLDPLQRLTEFQRRMLSALDRCGNESVPQSVKLIFNTSNQI